MPEDGIDDRARRTAGTRGLVARLGGRARVRAILDAFYARLFDDLMVGFFFAGKDRATIVDGQLAFLLKAFGEEATFAGRHPRAAHVDLPPIRKGHFNRRLLVLREVLAEHGVGADDIEAWVRAEESMRRHVQALPGAPS